MFTNATVDLIRQAEQQIDRAKAADARSAKGYQGSALLAMAELRDASRRLAAAQDLAAIDLYHQGASWQDIAESLDITRQAAHKKYAPLYVTWCAHMGLEPR